MNVVVYLYKHVDYQLLIAMYVMLQNCGFCIQQIATEYSNIYDL